MSNAFRPSLAKTIKNNGNNTHSSDSSHLTKLSSLDLQSNLQQNDNNNQKQYHQISEPSTSLFNNSLRVKIQSPLYNTCNIQNNFNISNTTSDSSNTISTTSNHQQMNEVCVFEMYTCYQ